MCMAWKSRPRGDGSSGGGASIFWTETVRTAPAQTRRAGPSTAHIGARGGTRAHRRCARERRRSSARTRCASTTRSAPRPPPAAGSGATVANPSAMSSASCPRARRWRSRWRRCPRSRSSSASPRYSRCTSASPRSRGWTATMVRLAPATSFAAPRDRRTRSFHPPSASFPALATRERSRARRAAPSPRALLPTVSPRAYHPSLALRRPSHPLSPLLTPRRSPTAAPTRREHRRVRFRGHESVTVHPGDGIRVGPDRPRVAGRLVPLRRTPPPSPPRPAS